ncbi:hypothetical protein M2272_000606 [Mycobacterium frederiksbergense]|uniref:NAD(P)H nitroreductase n=1 Tax=Mycolicibacterium frederiksbergense TaxID=117567 RepID=A0ABT6KVU6_9MYCO|nr:NAD(P)H nitroreductase [Mycolicibacterium frederiksbergense]MDH6193985.1 hypothetical protein [Mycolicibacterium frederiksbergense]
MGTNFPDVETIRTALSLAVRAPSVHNSQPWLWRIGEHSLHLYANSAAHLPHTDPDLRDLILSCGTTLNHCEVALAALGWGTKIHRFPNAADGDHLASMELHRYRPTSGDVCMAAAIPRRRTDRRRYSSWPVARGDIALMGARAARAGVMLRRVDELEYLRRMVAKAAQQHAADSDYQLELSTWSGRHGSAVGVPARSVPKADEAGPVPSRSFASGELDQVQDLGSTIDSAVVVALGTEADDDTTRLRAGEATSLVLLTATALGLASCPITEPLEVPSTRAAVAEEVFGEEGYLQMLIRIGWAPINADPLPSTPRRDLAEVAAFLTGKPLH